MAILLAADEILKARAVIDRSFSTRRSCNTPRWTTPWAVPSR
jgi:hypothetical protein